MTRLRETERRSTFVDIAGRRYGGLVAIGPEGFTDNRTTLWRFRCDCGKEVVRTAGPMKSGAVRSCGCLRKRMHSERLATHGLSRTPEYRIWTAMMTRCYSPLSKGYRSYGGRGIEVCDRWHSVVAFIEDMGNRPSAEHSIDRIDNGRGYEPGNCRWVTRDVQMNNKRTNHLLEFRGETRTKAEWSRITGLPYATICGRLRLGWPIEEALVRPLKPKI